MVSVEPSQFNRSNGQLIVKYNLSALKLTFILPFCSARVIPFRVIEAGACPCMHWAEKQPPQTVLCTGGQHEYIVAFPNPQFLGRNSMKETIFDEMILLFI